MSALVPLLLTGEPIELSEKNVAMVIWFWSFKNNMGMHDFLVQMLCWLNPLCVIHNLHLPDSQGHIAARGTTQHAHEANTAL